MILIESYVDTCFVTVDMFDSLVTLLMFESLKV